MGVVVVVVHGCSRRGRRGDVEGVVVDVVNGCGRRRGRWEAREEVVDEGEHGGECQSLSDSPGGTKGSGGSLSV